jgi:LPXTG-site transpeptidase (sortase) family protein
MNFGKITPKRKGRPKKEKRSFSKIAFGLALVILGFILIVGRNRFIEVLSTSFENEPVKIEGLKLANEFDGKRSPKRIIIPQLQIDLEVLKSDIVNGYWEVYEDSASWGVGSGYPGEKGNQVIFAHARDGLFLPLRSIKVGTSVYVFTDSTWHKYEVNEIKEVSPSQVEVIAPTEDETLTIYTCSGFADSKRLIVTAKPV